jgi:DNA helicase IV
VPLPDPKGKQAEVLCLPEEGHFVILGTAGSGKTTLAIHRAANLADSIIDKRQKVLLVTFNKSLVTYLNSSKLGEKSPSPRNGTGFHPTFVKY